MTKKLDRVRMLKTPCGGEKPAESPKRSGPPTVLSDLPRTIRRHELRMIVPLADTTIYDMEMRGEFPHRFNVTSRCIVWDLGKVEAWLRQHRQDSQVGRMKRAPSPNANQRGTRPARPVTE